MSGIIEISESVRHYYGQVLQSSNDLKTSACCSIDAIPAHLKTLIAALHPEVVERFYGCGSPLPPVLWGCTVLDLGCGSGRDCYLLSKLVGEEGRVIGVDMTPEQLEVATATGTQNALATKAPTWNFCTVILKIWPPWVLPITPSMWWCPIALSICRLKKRR
jgi:SAM-dependent methyltransferase